MSDAEAIDLIHAHRSDSTRFLKAIFNGLMCDGFRFPTTGTDGCIGANCISRYQKVALNNGEALALHLNFKCRVGEYRPPNLRLEITHFHLTARLEREQIVIDESGSSILTAANAVHINRNGDWGRAANIDNLAVQVALAGPALVVALNREYNTAYMRFIVGELRTAIETTVGVNAERTAIDFSSSDSTFHPYPS